MLTTYFIFFSLVFVPCVRIKQSSKDQILYFFNIYILSACSDKALWLPANVRDAEESFSKYYWVCAECIYLYYNATGIDYEFITCKPSYQDFCTSKVYFCLGEDIQYSGCLAQDDIGANSIEHELAPFAVIHF